METFIIMAFAIASLCTLSIPVAVLIVVCGPLIEAMDN